MVNKGARRTSNKLHKNDRIFPCMYFHSPVSSKFVCWQYTNPDKGISSLKLVVVQSKFEFTCSVDIKSVRSISFPSKRSKVQIYREHLLSKRSEIHLSDLIHVLKLPPKLVFANQMRASLHSQERSPLERGSHVGSGLVNTVQNKFFISPAV